jgi:hypothetical protein
MKQTRSIPAGICPEGELISAASRIVQDATEVDWCREPGTEYEGAIRAEYLATHLRTTLGRSSVMYLAFLYEGRMGSDLEAAADEALRIITERVAKYERDALDEARRAVDDRRPRG